jgi:hypothetical protein
MLMGRTIGVTGHQAREGIDWVWVRSAIADVLQGAAPVERAITSLAVGTDQVFAEEALAQAIKVQVFIPFAGYARCFESRGLDAYQRLLARCAETVVLNKAGTDQEAFLAAGIRVADESDLLIAVWDGRPAVGLGGTADVVAHALSSGHEVMHLDPILRVARRLSGSGRSAG